MSTLAIARARTISLRLPHWFILLGIAAVLRFVNLGQEWLWYDESFTAVIARLDLPHMFAAIRGDVHPPLFYLVEWLAVRVFGDSAFALRIPSAILGVITVLLVWRIASAVGLSERVALVAGLLTAVLPGQLYYSQDARMYPLLCVCVFGAVYAAIRSNWLLFAVAGIGAIYTQNLGWFYIGIIGYFVVFLRIRQPREMLNPLMAGIAIILAYLPWLPTFIVQSRAVQQGFWIQPLTPGEAIFPFMYVSMGWRLSDPFQMHVYAAALAMTVIGLIASRRWLFTRSGIYVLAVGVLVPLAVAVVSLLWRSVYLARALLPAVTLLVIPWAYGLLHLSKPNARIARAVIIPALAVALVAHYFPVFGSGREDMGPHLAPVKAGWQEGDVIYYLSIDGAILAGYYTRPLPYALLPFASDLNQSLTAETKQAIGLNQVPFEELVKRGYKRAWLIYSNNPLTSQPEIDELQQIEQRYPSKLLDKSGNDYISSGIVLVNLDEF